MDETYIGGKARNMHKNRKDDVIKGTDGAGKAIVVGILERHGGPGHSTVRTAVIPNTRKRTLQPYVKENVQKGSSVYSDAARGYIGLNAEYIHEAVDHAEKYVDGAVHITASKTSGVS